MEKYQVIPMAEDGFCKVINPNGGAVLGYSPESGTKLLEVEEDGFIYAFKDLNGNGVLDPYEDWRLPAEERAKDLASKLSIEELVPLLVCNNLGDQSGPELTEGAFRILDTGLRFGGDVRSNRAETVKKNNQVQAYIEAHDKYRIPYNAASDPINTDAGGVEVMFSETEASGWPGNLGLAATFDPNYTLIHGQVSSQEYRAYGIHVALSPQADLGTEPRWQRYAGTFGEGSKLAGDLAAAYVHGFQSTWDGVGADAEDLGWGKDSVVTMVKHFPGDSTAEAGREAHRMVGKHNVYPGYNLAEHISVFEKALHIERIYRTNAALLLRNSFLTGLFDNPYLETAVTKAALSNPEFKRLGFEAQKASVVMLKNKGIVKPCNEKKTVYIPLRSVPDADAQKHGDGGAPIRGCFL